MNPINKSYFNKSIKILGKYLIFKFNKIIKIINRFYFNNCIIFLLLEIYK